MNAHRDTKRQQLREVTFSDLSPQEEKQLFVYDQYFADDEAEKYFVVGGKEITAKLLAEALRSLPEEKREAVLLYYFFDMSETEIAKLNNIPRTTVRYRRTSSFELLKRYLEMCIRDRYKPAEYAPEQTARKHCDIHARICQEACVYKFQ